MPAQSARSFPAVLVIAGLLILFFLTSWTAWLGKSATYDEPLHFVASWIQTHDGDFRCDPEDPPLWRYYVAAGTSKDRLVHPTSGIVWDSMLTNRAVEGLYFKDVLYHTPANDADALISAGRFRMLFLGTVLAAAIAAWAWKLSGSVAAIIAATAFCLDPNFLAHAALVKNDVASALVFLLFAAAVWSVGNRATPLAIAALCLAIVAALTVKFSGVLAIPLLAIALLVRSLLPQPWTVWKFPLTTRTRRFLAAVILTLVPCLIGYVGIWASYGFRYGPSANPAERFDFNELLEIARTHEYFAKFNVFLADPARQQAFNAQWRPGLILRLGFWANAHHLFPQTWIEGFLFTYGTAPGRAAFLLGVSSMVGRWYYFPIAMLVKTPVATILASVAAAIYWLGKRQYAFPAWNAFALLFVPVAYFIVAVFSDLNLGIRHVLPIYPFLFIILGITAADAIARFRKPAIVAVAILAAALAAETAASYPDYIPFFNATAGGWRNGPELLADSNLDWGQDLPAIAGWQREHPRNQLFLSYFGSADPRYYGIHYVKLAGGQGPEDETVPDSRAPIYAVSANLFHNPFLPPDQRKFYDRLHARKPIAVLGHCIYLYNPPSE